MLVSLGFNIGTLIANQPTANDLAALAFSIKLNSGKIEQLNDKFISKDLFMKEAEFQTRQIEEIKAGLIVINADIKKLLERTP